MTSNLTKKYILRNNTRGWYVGLSKPIKGESLLHNSKDIIVETSEEIMIAKITEKEHPQHVVLLEEVVEEPTQDNVPVEAVVDDLNNNCVVIDSGDEDSQEDSTEECDDLDVDPTSEENTQQQSSSSVKTYSGVKRSKKARRMARLSEQQGSDQ